MSKRCVNQLYKFVLLCLSFSFVLLNVSSTVSAATYSVPETTGVKLTWDHNSPLPDGYRVYQRESGQKYDYSNPVWTGSDNLAQVYNLAYDITYYFVVRAYDGSLVSVDSEEVSFMAPAPSDGTDTDSNDPVVNDGQTTTETVINDGDTGTSTSGNWSVSGGADPYGSESFYSKEAGATYTYTMGAPGTYEVEMWWTEYASRSTAVPVKIYDGSTLLETIYVNQQVDGGQWNFLGVYEFFSEPRVVIVSVGNGYSTCADAVRFLESTDVSSEDVLDDGDAGTSTSGNWSVSGGANPYGSQSLYSKDAGATYSYAMAASGSYEIQMWWTEYTSRSTAVPVKIYDGSTLLDTVYVNQQQDGGQWNSLGVYDFSTQARVAIVSVGNGNSTCADAVRFAETTSTPTSSEEVLDDGDTGTSTSGNWSVSGGANPYGSQSVWSKDAGATYSYALAVSGSYEIQMWWTEYASRSTAVPVKIYDGSTLLDTVYVNQQQDGGQWNSLGVYNFSTQAKVVVVSVGNGKSTCADAVRFAETTSTPTASEEILDNGDAGTSTSGNWPVSGGANPYGSQSVYSKDAGATYSYALAASGSYEIQMWWTEYTSRSTAVPVQIYNGSTLLDTVYVNQQQDGGQWNSLGVYNFSTQAKVVVVSVGNGKSTCADAVRFTK
jgi:hypothetical protein